MNNLIEEISKDYFHIISRNNTNREKRELLRSISLNIENLKITDYFYLDCFFRKYIRNNYTGEIHAYSKIMFLNKEEQFIQTALNTFHPNYAVRRDNLNNLIQSKNPRRIPFILMRTVDWVDKISIVANENIFKIIRNDEFSNLLKAYPLIYRMRKLLRFNYEGTISSINKRVLEENVTTYLKAALQSYDNNLRRYALEQLVNKPLDNLIEYANLIEEEPIPATRVIIVNKLLSKISYNELLEIKDILLNDKSPKVKIKVINKLYYNGYYNSYKDLIIYALDSHITLRDEGRFYMKKLGCTNIKEIYKGNIDLKGAVLGLCDIATKEDIQDIKLQLNKWNGKVRKSILKTMGIVDFNGCKEEIVKELKCGYPDFSKIAKDSIINNKDSIDPEMLYKILCESNYQHCKVNIAIILCNLSKWTSIYYIIILHLSEIHEIRDIANKYLGYWICNYNSNCTLPKKTEKERALKALEDSKERISLDKCRELKFIIR